MNARFLYGSNKLNKVKLCINVSVWWHHVASPQALPAVYRYVPVPWQFMKRDCYRYCPVLMEKKLNHAASSLHAVESLLFAIPRSRIF